MLNLIIIGAPGSGKGTQAELIQENFGLRHFSTGAQIRREIAAGTEIGILVKDCVARGELVSDDLVNKVVESAISQDKEGLIFDGYPRSIAQEEILDQLLSKYHETPLRAFIYLDVRKELLLERIIERGKTSGRADDTPEVFEDRYRAYLKETQPLIDSYRKKGILVEVDGNGTPEDIYNNSVKPLMESYLK
ncbi:MAG: adenylate kinase [Candidatus Falkowbacteria bacterium]|nr:adenylate kinase [Candidatus Falkowbacteria bacterium]